MSEISMAAVIPAYIGAGVSVVMGFYAIVRNGSRSKTQDEKLKTELKAELSAIKGKLDDPQTGLTAIKRATEEQKLHCATVSTGLSVRVQNHDEEIARLREKRDK